MHTWDAESFKKPSRAKFDPLAAILNLPPNPLDPMRADQAKTISISAYLAHLGSNPVRSRKNGTELWYHSPIRKGERTASFKVDATLNKWYDHGLGEGGNTLDLAIAIHGVSVRDALALLERTGLFHGISGATGRAMAGMPSPEQQKLTHVRDVVAAKRVADEKEKQDVALKLLKAVDVRHPALLEYLADRTIDQQIAQKYLREVHFTNADGSKKFFALGWPVGDGQSFEVRNKFFKGLVGPDKTITHLEKAGSDTVLVFEGFFDFLAYLTEQGAHQCQSAVIILNSTSQKTKAAAAILEAGYLKALLYLDNDDMGNASTVYFEQTLQGLEVVDGRSAFGRAKDFNEKLMQA